MHAFRANYKGAPSMREENVAPLPFYPLHSLLRNIPLKYEPYWLDLS